MYHISITTQYFHISSRNSFHLLIKTAITNKVESLLWILKIKPLKYGTFLGIAYTLKKQLYYVHYYKPKLISSTLFEVGQLKVIKVLFLIIAPLSFFFLFLCIFLVLFLIISEIIFYLYFNAAKERVTYSMYCIKCNVYYLLLFLIFFFFFAI